MQFLVGAWASTIHYFSEQVRMTKRSAHDIISNIGAWEHKWKWSSSSAASVGSGGHAGGREPDNKALQNQIDSMKGQVKRFQQQAGRASRSAMPEREWRENDEDEGSNRRNRGKKSAAAKRSRANSNNGNPGKGGKGKGGGRKGKRY